MNSGAMVSTVASQQEGLGFESWLWPFCVEFPSLSMCGLSSKIRPRYKDMLVDQTKLNDSECLSVFEC